MLDDNGNGEGNEKQDGLMAKQYQVGNGIVLAADEPIIKTVMTDQTLEEEAPVILWVGDVSATTSIDRVWAVVQNRLFDQEGSENPEFACTVDNPVVEMTYQSETRRYEKVYQGFPNVGSYNVSFYAMDVDGNVSSPAHITIRQESGPDVYESDDATDQAGTIVINHANAQKHNFHHSEDLDWIKFYGIADVEYTISAAQVSAGCNLSLGLYAADGQTQLGSMDNNSEGLGETLSWTCPETDFYLVRIQHTGQIGTYQLMISDNTVDEDKCKLTGVVVDAESHVYLEGIAIWSDLHNSAISQSDGTFHMILPTGKHTISAGGTGYFQESYPNIQISNDQYSRLTIELLPAEKPDTDGDGIPDEVENTTCTDPNDADTDDDGIPDGVEDANQNGNQDSGETNPCNNDSDGDGIQDGTESGYGIEDVGPDTDTSVFQPDLDQGTSTDPLKSDTDGDGDSDGEEDPNHNGRVDSGETDPNVNENSIFYIEPGGTCADKSPCYASIQDAINAASSGIIMRIAQGTYSESITLNKSKNLTLQGGWDPSFATQTSNTTFIKAPKATQGALTLQMISIRP